VTSAADDNADALPSASRDAGNRFSFAGLRAFAVTRDSDLPHGQRGIARAIRLIWNDLSIACDDSRESGRGDVRDG
jgi:hypothetical protein